MHRRCKHYATSRRHSAKPEQRMRIFVTNIARDWESVGRVHREFFKGVIPATTMVEVSRLIVPEMLVEIEADAVTDTDEEQDAHCRD